MYLNLLMIKLNFVFETFYSENYEKNEKSF